MERIARAFLLLTGLGYTVLLFYTYAYFADLSFVQVKIGGNFQQISNDFLFYAGLIIPAVIIVICLILGTIIHNQPVSSNSYFKNERTKKRLYSWSISLAGAFNLFFSALLTVILFTNNQEGMQHNGYVPILIGSLLFFLFWIIWLPMILVKNK